MRKIGVHEAQTRLPKILDHVARGESLTITRYGRPVARLVPTENEDHKGAEQAAWRIANRRRRLKQASVADLIDTLHEGRRF